MIHTYSLIHDDLSAMDNDELRSGKPTNHRVFGEGMAILAGDGLLTEDCSLLSNAAYLYGQITKEIALRAIREIALSAGLHGLVAGQAQDLLSEDSEPDSETLSFIHLKRQLSSSGAVRLGGILASCSEQELTGFSECGQRIGLTFQIVGAILDVERKSEVPGNPKGSDEKGEKDDLSSSIWAGRESRKRAHDLVEEELETQEGFGDRADPLRGITLSSSKDITELLLFSFPPNSGMLEEGHTMLLQTINGPGDLKAFNTEELKALAEEVRSLIIERVSLNGGHLSSNLGVVELSIALHYVFNSPADKIVWDVGHQSYAHKLLTGRHRQFKTLRTHGGISGFPRITESPHDAFGTGHSSTSISAALGIIEARDKKKEFFKVIAVIGDGALTGGLAFEGLNHAGHLKKDLIVILNDNEMSISPNVGALSNYLSRVLTGTFFKKFKKETRAILEGIPRIGESVARIAERAEDSLKGFFLPGGLFMDLGFNYIGPIDGHDITLLIETLDRLRGTSGPTLVHLVTKKGKGYTFSEDDPCVFHGIGPFTVETGLPNGEKSRPQLKGSTRLEEPWTSYCDAFGQALVEIADGDRRVVAITAAMKEGTGLADYAKAFPERFYDVGIAEPHAVTFAAGLAAGGLKPVVTVYSTFLQRAYDQIVHDVCLQKLPVVFAVDRAGIVGEDGATHQGLFDVSLLRTVPNLVLMAPKDTDELKAMLRFAISYNGPAALRYPRGKMRRDSGSTGTPPVIELGKAELIREGDDLAILALGDTVYRALIAAERLEDQGIRVSVVNPRFVKPLDDVLILSLAQRCRRIVTIEENILAGGFGTAVLECLSTAGLTDVIVKRIGIDDVYVEHGSQVTLRKKYGLDEETITKVMFALLEESPCRPAF